MFIPRKYRSCPLHLNIKCLPSAEYSSRKYKQAQWSKAALNKEHICFLALQLIFRQVGGTFFCLENDQVFLCVYFGTHYVKRERVVFLRSKRLNSCTRFIIGKTGENAWWLRVKETLCNRYIYYVRIVVEIYIDRYFVDPRTRVFGFFESPKRKWIFYGE